MRVITLGLLLSIAAVAQELPSAFWESPQVREGQYVLWRDPGNVETLDFRYGIGGEAMAPKPPFTFVEEDPSGTTPKVHVNDANDRQWVIKFGNEASPDTFCTRLAWAVGYYAEPNYFVPEGRNRRRPEFAARAQGYRRAREISRLPDFNCAPRTRSS